MSEITELLESIRDDIEVVRSNHSALIADRRELAADKARLERENELLRARIDELAPPPLDYTDDMRDAAIDRQREADWQRSTDRYARGERE